MDKNTAANLFPLLVVVVTFLVALASGWVVVSAVGGMVALVMVYAGLVWLGEYKARKNR